MAPKHEARVGPSKPMPAGYTFLPKGDSYKTLHCRRLTNEGGKPVFVVVEGKAKREKVLGIRIPKSILLQVQSLASETLASRRAATEQRDNALVRKAATALDTEFPKIPEAEKEMILEHGFKKYSGRVGRTSQIPMSKKVMLAVIAHIRHTHTDYDELLDAGMDRAQARRQISKELQDTLRKWGSKSDLSWYFDYSGEESSEEMDVLEEPISTQHSDAAMGSSNIQPIVLFSSP